MSNSREKIRNLIVDWIELLAQEKYAEALELILYDNTQIVDGKLWVWTPEKLESAIFTYGLPWFTKEDMKREFGADCCVDYKVTSILKNPDKDKLLEDIKSSIDFFDYTIWELAKYIAKPFGVIFDENFQGIQPVFCGFIRVQAVFDTGNIQDFCIVDYAFYNNMIFLLRFKLVTRIVYLSGFICQHAKDYSFSCFHI